MYYIYIYIYTRLCVFEEIFVSLTLTYFDNGPPTLAYTWFCVIGERCECLRGEFRASRKFSNLFSDVYKALTRVMQPCIKITISNNILAIIQCRNSTNTYRFTGSTCFIFS